MSKKKKKKKKLNSNKKKKFNYVAPYSLQPGARGHIYGYMCSSPTSHVPGYTISSGSNNCK